MIMALSPARTDTHSQMGSRADTMGAGPESLLSGSRVKGVIPSMV